MRCVASSITSHANCTYRILFTNLLNLHQYHTSKWLAKEHALRPATPSRASSRPLTPRLPSSALPSPRSLRSPQLSLLLSPASPLVSLRRRPRRRTVSPPRLVGTQLSHADMSFHIHYVTCCGLFGYCTFRGCELLATFQVVMRRQTCALCLTTHRTQPHSFIPCFPWFFDSYYDHYD